MLSSSFEVTQAVDISMAAPTLPRDHEVVFSQGEGPSSQATGRTTQADKPTQTMMVNDQGKVASIEVAAELLNRERSGEAL